jgi:hypothetical protein
MLRRVGDLQAHPASVVDARVDAPVDADPTQVYAPPRLIHEVLNRWALGADERSVSDLDVEPSPLSEPSIPSQSLLQDGDVVRSRPMLPALAVRAPVGQRFASAPSAADVQQSSADEQGDELPQGTRKLIPLTWLRFVMIVGSIATVPVGFVVAISAEVFDGSSWTDESTWSSTPVLLPIAMPIMSFVALVAWSGVAALNAARARELARHQTRPRAFEAVVSWFVPVVVVVVIIVGISVIGRVAGETRASIDRGEGDGEMVVALLTGLLAVAVLLATYRPFVVLRRLSRWVSGDHVRFRNWFLSPFAGAAVGACLASFYQLAQLSESLAAKLWIRPVVVVVAVLLPWMCWVIVGNRAMADLEAATEYAHRRRLDDARTTAAAAHAAAERISGA